MSTYTSIITGINPPRGRTIDRGKGVPSEIYLRHRNTELSHLLSVDTAEAVLLYAVRDIALSG